MSASCPAIVFPPSSATLLVTDVELCEAAKRTLGVIGLDIARPGQVRLTGLQWLRASNEAAPLLVIKVHGELSAEKPKTRLIQAETDYSAWKICQPTAHPKRGWVHAVICVLLVGCCAITVFSVFQAPLGFRSKGGLTEVEKVRTEIAALPVRLGAQTMSRIYAPDFQQCARGVHAGNPADDRLQKTSRDGRPFQKTDSEGCSQPGQLAQRK
jgi:hypothetical protein